MAIDNELEKRRLGLDFANRLKMLAADAPDVFTEKAVLDMARLIDKRFTYSKELRKKEILTHLKKSSANGGMSIGELIEETGYNKNRVYEAMDELESEGRAELRRVQPAGDRGGRPSARYFAVTIGFSQTKT